MAIDPKSEYYDAGGIETIEIIKAKLTKEQYIGYLLGCILKYSCRVNWKGNMVRDLEKIDVYQKLLIQFLENEELKPSIKKNIPGTWKIRNE